MSPVLDAYSSRHSIDLAFVTVIYKPTDLRCRPNIIVSATILAVAKLLKDQIGVF